jgi:hypothetical protein
MYFYEEEYTINNGIGVFPSIVSKEDCQSIINFFEGAVKEDLGHVGSVHGGTDVAVKDSIDLQLMLPQGLFTKKFNFVYKPEEHLRLLNLILSAMQVSCNLYSEHLSNSLQVVNPLSVGPELRLTSCQIQKYPKGSLGYPGLHIESSAFTTTRFLAPLLYLNTIEEGGQTDVPYFDTKVQAVEGTVLVLPCDIPYYHRGLPAINQDKYVVTSWLEYPSENELNANAMQHIAELEREYLTAKKEIATLAKNNS